MAKDLLGKVSGISLALSMALRKLLSRFAYSNEGAKGKKVGRLEDEVSPLESGLKEVGGLSSI
jgi:hypothetical protein